MVASAALALLFNAFVWGLSWWPLHRLQDAGVHPLWATALIYLLALAVTTAGSPRAWRGVLRRPGLWTLMLASGLTNVGFNWAVTTGDVVRVVLLFYLMPAWSVLWAWFLLRERAGPRALLRVALALCGVGSVLYRPGAGLPWPQDLADGLALLGGLGFALTNVLLLRLRETAPVERIVAMFGGGALLATVLACGGTLAGRIAPVPAADGAWLAWLAVTAIAFLGGNFALQYGAARLPAGTTALLMVTEIVFASVSSIALGASQWAGQTALGGALILAAAAWAAFDQPASASSSSSTQ